MHRIGKRLNATTLLLLLLALDLLLVALHIIVEIPIYTDSEPILKVINRQMFLITIDGGYGEWFQYFKFGAIILLLHRIVRKGGSARYANWGLIFTLLLFDDSLRLHEGFGRILANAFTFVAPFNLRLQDVGELIASATFGIVLLLALAHAFIYGSAHFRKRSIDIAMLVFALAFFGVGVDLLGPISTSTAYRVTIGTLEDVGEMVVVSVTLWYIFQLAKHGTYDPPWLFERLPIVKTIMARLSLDYDTEGVQRRLAVVGGAVIKPFGRINISLLIFIAYCAFVAVITWPALGRLGTHIPGDGGDAFVHLWNFEWARDSLLNWQSPFFTTRIFYPGGVDLNTHNFAWLNIAVWLPLQTLLGSATAYTLTFTAAFVLNAFAGYWLIRELTKQTAVAFIGGLMMGGWQYTLAQSTRPNLVLIGFIPLTMWAILRLIQTTGQPGNKRYSWLTLIFVAALGITRIQLFAMSLVLLVPWTLYCLSKLESSNRIHAFTRLILPLLGAGLLILPTVLPIISYQLAREFPDDIFEISRTKFTDLTAYILPWGHHPLLGKFAEPFGNPLIKTFFIGITPIVLFAYGVFDRGRLRLFWIATSIVLLLFAIGDRLVINNQVFFDMPYALLKSSNIDEFIGNPTRFNAILGIPFVIVGAFGVAKLLGRVEGVFRPNLILFLTVLIVAEARIPYPLLSTGAPAWYSQLAEEDGDFGILPFPHARRYSENYMNYQRHHGKGIVEGHVSRLPREASDYINSVPLLSYLAENYVFAQETLPPEDINNLSEQFAALADADIRYFIIHKKWVHSDVYGKWREWMAVEPIWEDEEVLVYSTNLLSHIGTRTAAGNSVNLLQTITLTQGKRSAQTAEFTAHWLIDDATNVPESLCLNVTDFEPSCTSFAPPLVPSTEPQLVQTRHRLPLDKRVPAGDVSVFGRFDQSQPFPFTTLNVGGPSRQFDLPTPDQPDNVTFNNELILLGHDNPVVIDGQLNLTVYWQALVEKSQSVQYFVHVLNSDGNLIAQADAAPRNWAYPTTEWAQDEIVDDTITIDFSQQPPGNYTLSIGLVNVETLDRLEATTPDGKAVPDSSHFLGTLNTNPE